MTTTTNKFIAQQCDQAGEVVELCAEPVQQITHDCPSFEYCKGLCFQCEYFDSEPGLTEYPKPIAPPVQPAAQTRPFRGDDTALCNNIEALLSLDASDSLVPHGIGGHARTLLEASYVRLSASSQPEQPTVEQLHKFLDTAAGEGLVLAGVCAADLYIALFPEFCADAIVQPALKQVEPVGINGLTQRETSASMSVMGLSWPQAAQPVQPAAQQVIHTNWLSGMLQDDNRALSRWLAGQPNALHHVKADAALAALRMERAELTEILLSLVAMDEGGHWTTVFNADTRLPAEFDDLLTALVSRA